MSDVLYLLTEGEYSGYRVLAGALDEETLTTYLDKLAGLDTMKARDMDITSVPLLPAGAAPSRVFWYGATQNIYRDGVSGDVRVDVSTFLEDVELRPAEGTRPNTNVYTRPDGQLRVTACGRDKEGVVKAVADRVASICAEMQGLV